MRSDLEIRQGKLAGELVNRLVSIMFKPDARYYSNVFLNSSQ